ncbi:hypothetical protein Tco_1114969 [Tanacetum coccineum]
MVISYVSSNVNSNRKLTEDKRAVEPYDRKLFQPSLTRLEEARYREYDLAHLKLIFEFSIYTVWKSVRYGVSKGLDTAYWSFLGRIDLLSFVVFGECRHGYAVSSLLDTVYWSSE